MSLNMDFHHIISCKKFLANLAFESLFVKLMDSSRSSNFLDLTKNLHICTQVPTPGKFWMS
jgi:hypothetical protein